MTSKVRSAADYWTIDVKLTITHPFVVMARKRFLELSLVKMLHRSLQIHKAYRGKRVC